MEEIRFKVPNGEEVTEQMVKEMIFEYGEERTAQQLGYKIKRSLHRLVTQKLKGTWESREQMLKKRGLPDRNDDIHILNNMFASFLTFWYAFTTEDLSNQIPLQPESIRLHLNKLAGLGYVDRVRGSSRNGFCLTGKGAYYLVKDQYKELQAAYYNEKEPKDPYDKLCFRILGFALDHFYAPSREEIERMSEAIFDIRPSTVLRQLREKKALDHSYGLRKVSLPPSTLRRIMSDDFLEKRSVLVEKLEYAYDDLLLDTAN